MTRLGPGGGTRTSDWFDDVCSAEELARIEALLGPRVSKIDGGPRQFALAKDQIGQCLALKNAHGAEVNAYYMAR